jgi:hypothetical protein
MAIDSGELGGNFLVWNSRAIQPLDPQEFPLRLPRFQREIGTSRHQKINAAAT